MTWESFTLGGVAANQAAMNEGFDVAYEPVLGTEEARHGPTGTGYYRLHWRKGALVLSGEGAEALDLPGVDYGQPLTLVLRRPTGFSTYDDETLTVFARPPQMQEDRIRARHTWALECVEVNAQVLHSLPYVVELGGQTPHALALLDCTWSPSPIVGGSLLRMGDGSGNPRVAWRKTGFSVSGGGWVPLDVWSGLDFSGALTLKLSELSSIDGNDNPVYATQSYSIWTPGISEDWDPVNRLYSWSFDAEQV